MIVKDGKVQSRLLYCQVCEVWTNHVAVIGGFVCSCGEEVVSVRRDAVRLAIANEAEQDLLKGYEG